MKNKPMRKRTKIERMMQRMNSWSLQVTDTKVAFAMIVFLIAVTVWFR